MAYQCINMGKVFTYQEQIQTTEHAIALWYKIMIDAGMFNIEDKSFMLDFLLQNIKGVASQHYLYFQNLNKRFEGFKKETVLKILSDKKVAGGDNQIESVTKFGEKIMRVVGFSDSIGDKQEEVLQKKANVILLLKMVN